VARLQKEVKALKKKLEEQDVEKKKKAAEALELKNKLELRNKLESDTAKRFGSTKVQGKEK
jgi:hypothetical protein